MYTLGLHFIESDVVHQFPLFELQLEVVWKAGKSATKPSKAEGLELLCAPE